MEFNDNNQILNNDLKRKVCEPSRSISREQIRNTLNKIYSKESKPVQVKTIKSRTIKALVFIYIGTIFIVLALSSKYITLETNLILPGLVLLSSAFLIGFALTTKNIRKINNSMRRFKVGETPAYRTIFSEPRWRTQALVYAVLFSLIFLGAQNVNLMFSSSNLPFLNDNIADEKVVELKDNMVWIENFILGDTYIDNGQNYRYVIVEINNSINYYSKNLFLKAQSIFAGEIIDEINITFNEPEIDIKLISLKIHDADDTTIIASLNFIDQKGERELDSVFRWSVDDIYIVTATGRVTSKPGFIYKSVEISVTVYNERQVWGPDAVTVIVTDTNIFGTSVYRGSIKNNETLDRGEFWEVKFKIDNIIDQELEFNIKLNIDEKTKDEIRVMAE